MLVHSLDGEGFYYVSHQSLYRKYRPTTFESVVGQSHIERTLRNAVATDSVAHAYLFSGPRGTGKTTTARILAAALVCGHTEAGEPDGSCEQCQQVNEGRHPDIIELDAASQTGVDNVREEIINNMHLATVHGKSKVYIIDEVHMLSKPAFNALLKTLEEPPAQVVFILCTTDPQKVLSTVRSRCQEFDFHPIAVGDIAERLRFIAEEEKIKADPAALELIARHAEGGMRDAITLFERMIAYSGGNIQVSDVEKSMGGISGDSLASLMFILAKRDTPACFAWVEEQVSTGTDLVEAVRALLDYARDVYVTSVLGAEAAGVNRSDEELQILNEITSIFAGPQQLERLLDLLFDLSDKLRWSTEPRILLELTLARATQPQGETNIEALLERVESLEATLAGTGQVAAVAPKPAVDASPLPLSSKSAATRAAVAAPKEQASAETAPSKEPAPAVSASPPTSTSVQAAPPAQTSAPAPINEPTSSAPELRDDLATRNRNWSSILEQIREIEPSRHPVFVKARLKINVDEQSLIVEFPKADTFWCNKAKQVENKELLSKAIQAVFGRELSYVIELGDFEAPATPAAATPAPTYEPAPVPDYEPVYEEPGSALDTTPGYVPDYEVVPGMDAPPPPPVQPIAEKPQEAEPIPPVSVLESSPAPEGTPPERVLEVATLLDEMGATVIRESSE